MYGAILGDMVGAPYEFDRGDKSKDFEMFGQGIHYTDDTVMSIAVAEALLSAGKDADEQTIKEAVVSSMRKWGRRYPNAGYGGGFRRWLTSRKPQPYNSWGNGSAMRVSSVGWLYDTEERTREVARWTAEVTHNHPEGIKGAEATALSIFMARNGRPKDEIRLYECVNFDYDLSRTCDEIRPDYHHVESCQETVPEAFTAFYEGEDFEDVIRTAVSLGGDSDTLTCIAGGMAEAYYGIPLSFEAEVRFRLPDDMLKVLDQFDRARGRGRIDDDYAPSNRRIDEEIEEFYKDGSNENLGRIIYALRNAVWDGCYVLVPVVAPENAIQMFDIDKLKVGDVVTSDEDLHFKFQHLETDDGRSWAVFFTSEMQYREGISSDIIRMDLRQLLEGFQGDGAEAGLVINPWGKKFLLTKDLIKVVLNLNKPENDIKFYVGDITELDTDAIVNAANSSLLGGGGVDGAIHRAAGPELLEECRSLNGCRTGEAKITKGYRLPARYVIHTVGPIYSGSRRDADDLYNCYYNSLELARDNGLHTVDFPAISTGVYGYPKEEAAKIAYTAVLNWQVNNPEYGIEVVFALFSKADHKIYVDVLDELKREAANENK